MRRITPTASRLSLLTSVTKLLGLAVAYPLQYLTGAAEEGSGGHHHGQIGGIPGSDEPFPAEPVDTAAFWWKVAISVVLVLAGGVFAGLTLGLMGQDVVNLKVVEASGTPLERKHAHSVLSLLERGKHWVLVTLLLSNVITNETLPIVADSVLGGGWPAIVISTVSIVIFGEIIPQSMCVRYGLGIGARCAPFVVGLMYVLYPIAYPTAMLLDWALGEDTGTMYKKAGLKTLVSLHGNSALHSHAEALNEDEVTIISAVLDLKETPIGDVMTPIQDVYVMSAEHVLDEKVMDEILSAGYSRIPIHAPGQPTNFIGMLLVKTLITYDPEDARPVSSFALATLPETACETSCLDMLNWFQEGKSHMVIVSEHPGENHGALGVVTLEDIIEELIGEEIVDETDVFIDVRGHLKRAMNPNLLRKRYTQRVASAYGSVPNNAGGLGHGNAGQKGGPALNPKNVASRPMETRNQKVKIKAADVATAAGAYNVMGTEEAAVDAAQLANVETGSPVVSVGNSRPNSGESNKSGHGKNGGLKPPSKTKARSGSIVERQRMYGGVSKTVVETSDGTTTPEETEQEGSQATEGDRERESLLGNKGRNGRGRK
ncbi:cell agglutination protein Mam3 [Saitoella coloradoensis]